MGDKIWQIDKGRLDVRAATDKSSLGWRIDSKIWSYLYFRRANASKFLSSVELRPLTF